MKLRHNLLCTALTASTLVSLPMTDALAVGNVKLLFNNNPQIIALNKLGPLDANGVLYFPNTAQKYLQMRLADPLLCAEFPTSTNNNVRVRMLNANGDLVANNNVNGSPNTFGSLTAISGSTGGIRYQTDGSGDHRLVLNTTGELVCYTFSTFVMPNSVDSKSAGKSEGLSYTLVPVPGNVVAKGAGGDMVFADGFESPFVGPADVVTTLNAPPTVRADQSYVYTITVRNAGGLAVNGVVVRDFFYKAGSTSISGAAVFQNGTWTCAPGNGGSCGGSTVGTGVIFAPSVNLDPNGEVTFTATRPFNTSPAPPATGRTFGIAAAAFTNPTAGEVVQVNNSTSASGTIVITQPPVISGPATPQAMLEDASATLLNFTISDPDPEGITLATVSASSNNQALIPNSAIILGGSGANRSLTVTPVANANGSATIAIVVSDGSGNSTTRNVVFNVTAVNDAPSFNFRADCPIKGPGSWSSGSNPPEFAFPAGTIGGQTCTSFTVPSFGAGDSGQALTEVLVDSNSNTSLFVPGQLPRFSNTLNQLQFQTTGASGVADITIRVRDDGGTANGGVDVSTPRTFRIRVQGVVPTMTAIGNQVILEDGNTGAIPFTVTDTDTPLNTLVLSATSSDPSLVPNGNISFGGAMDARELTVTPLANQNGSTDITVTVSDGAQQSQQTFTVNVTAVNDAPTFVAGTDVILPTGTTDDLYQEKAWAGQLSVGPANESSQVLENFVVTQLAASSPNILSGSISISVINGNLAVQLQPVAGVVPDGFVCLRVRLRDSGAITAPNVNLSQPHILKVEVGNGGHDCGS